MTFSMWMPARALRARRWHLVVVVVLAFWLTMMQRRSEAAQRSIEEAAKAAGLTVKTGTATVDRVTLHYRDIGPRTEPVILLHGFPETGDAFAPAVATLGKRFQLIVPDMRGGSFTPADVTCYVESLRGRSPVATLSATCCSATNAVSAHGVPGRTGAARSTRPVANAVGGFDGFPSTLWRSRHEI